ncbi:hypothetical protein KAI78_07400 [bacterium]|nr:hypothetical protein [bacterium]
MKKLITHILIGMLTIALLVIVGCKYEAPVEPLPSLSGSLELETIVAAYLGGTVKEYYVYLPPSYDTSADSFPVIYLFHGFGFDYSYFKNWTAIKYLLDELISDEAIQEMVVVMPDGKNDLAGSFYTNSYDVYNSTGVFGYYENYMIQELIPTAEALYAKIDPARRAIGGISMGGYGSMYLAENNSAMFQTVFSHSGPIYFEALKPILPGVVAENPLGLTQTNVTAGVSGPSAERPLTAMGFAMSGAFDPIKSASPADFGSDTDARFILSSPGDGYYYGVEVPFDPVTSVFNDTIFDTIWVPNFDPSDPTRIANLNGLNIFFDAGDQDELGMNFQAVGFSGVLDAVLPAQAYTYETFTGGHTNKLYERLRVSLKFVSDNF